MSELHLVVLWEFARSEEKRILEDMPRHVEVLHTEVLRWSGDPQACFGRFYGANLADACGKVLTCGGGPFRLVVVRDNAPRYGLVETSRGLESANLNLFELKTRYREWTGGGHRVHTTNTVAEAEHDIFFLTGHTAAEWTNGRPAGELRVLPGQNGWASLRELFSFLGRFAPYVVLRNAETLPDAFDPSLHGDIDLLVEDVGRAAHLLGARKVFPEPHRVHYEVKVGGRPVRFDFRFIGDGYYDTAWERRMLERRVQKNGVWLLHPEDAYYALVYHALFHKFEIAPDYVAKVASLANAAGLAWTDFGSALQSLEAFLAREGYAKTRPTDVSVRWNGRLVDWRLLADEIASISGASDVRPVRLEALRAATPLRTFFYSARWQGRKCFIKYSPCARNLTEAEWRHPQALARNGDGALFESSLFWHATADGGAFVIIEWIDGMTLDERLARHDPILSEKADVIVADLIDIASALARAKIVHRDIRPANLIVSADGHVRLIDFQFAAPSGDSAEDRFFADIPEVIDGLGAEYALAPGQWNDRHSLRKILSELPATPARDRGLVALAADNDTPTKVAACTRGKMRKLKRRRACLLRKKLVARFSAAKMERFERQYERELAFLNRAVATWHLL